MTLTNESGTLPARGFCDVCNKDRILSRCDIHTETHGKCYRCHLSEFHLNKEELVK